MMVVVGFKVYFFFFHNSIGHAVRTELHFGGVLC